MTKLFSMSIKSPIIDKVFDEIESELEKVRGMEVMRLIHKLNKEDLIANYNFYVYNAKKSYSFNIEYNYITNKIEVKCSEEYKLFVDFKTILNKLENLNMVFRNEFRKQLKDIKEYNLLERWIKPDER